MLRAAARTLLPAALIASGQGRYKVNTKTDYYKLLKLKNDFSADDLKQAYRAAAKKYHPDKNPGDEKAALKFSLVSEANEVLGDPSKRRQYDRATNRGQNTGKKKPSHRRHRRGGPGFHSFHQSPRRQAPREGKSKSSPPEVAHAQRTVSRVATLSALKKLVLNRDTGKVGFHLVHAFYLQGVCELRLDSELRFPYPFADATDSGLKGHRRWDQNIRFAKTEMTPTSPSYAEAKKLQEKLGAPDVQKQFNMCPAFVFIKRGACLRAKEAQSIYFPKRTHNAFQDWLHPLMKVAVTFKNDCLHHVVAYWVNDAKKPNRNGKDDWGAVAARMAPGSESVQYTFPTHTFAFVDGRAHEAADAEDVVMAKSAAALPLGIRLLTHVVSSEEGVRVSIKAPLEPVDSHVSCRRANCSGKSTLKWARKCPRTCGHLPQDSAPPRPGQDEVATQENLFRRPEL